MSTPQLPPLPTGRRRRRQPCAACRLRSKPCPDDCLLAPYFPAERAAEYANVRRLFGYQNVLDMLNKVAPELRDDAITSITYEANFRAAHPVGGCTAAIAALSHQINYLTAELEAVNQALARCMEMQNLNQNPGFLNLDQEIQENAQWFFYDDGH